MSHRRRLAYPSPKLPPPIARSVIGTPQRGQSGATPAAIASRIACSSAAS